MDLRSLGGHGVAEQAAKCAERWAQQVALLKTRFSVDELLEVESLPVQATDVLSLRVVKECLLKLMQVLKTEALFEYAVLSDLTAVDHLPEVPRFEVIYHLLSLSQKMRMRVRVRVGEGDSVPTLSGMWPGANWLEREVYDMFGVPFAEHPDLRRILMDTRWVGHPLRKDYPLAGFQVFTEPLPGDPGLLQGEHE